MKRLVSVLLGMLGFFLFLHAVDADAATKAVGLSPGRQHNAGFIFDVRLSLTCFSACVAANRKRIPSRQLLSVG